MKQEPTVKPRLKDLLEEFCQATSRLSVLEQLLQKHPEAAKMENEEGRTLFQEWCIKTFTPETEAAIRLLHGLGANVNAVGQDGRSALYWAVVIRLAEPDQEEIDRLARLLIELGAEVNIGAETFANPLHAAVRDLLAPWVQTLLECTADPNVKDHHGGTPLARLAEEEESKYRQGSLEKALIKEIRSMLRLYGGREEGRRSAAELHKQALEDSAKVRSVIEAYEKSQAGRPGLS